MSTFYVNLALKKVIRDSGVNTKGTIFFKSTQIFFTLTMWTIVAISIDDLKTAFMQIEKAAKIMGLTINEEETKVLISSTTKSVHQSIGQNLNVDLHNFS